MVAPNLFGFVEGYRAQQGIELADAEERRRQEAERRQAELQAQRNTLFEQTQQEFLANQQLREAERALNLQRAAGGLELLQVSQPNAVEAARFTGLTDAATRAAMTPVVPQLAQAGAQTLLDRVITAQTQAGTARTQADLTRSFLEQPGVIDTLRQTQVNATEAAQAKTALGRLIAQQDLATASDPQVQTLTRAAQMFTLETQALNNALQLGRMDHANAILQQRGVEIMRAPAGAGAPYMIRELPSGDWRPWQEAMGLPVYSQMLKNMELAAQAYERQARATAATGGGVAPVAALGLGVGATATPLAGRVAPAQPAPQAPSPAPAPVSAPAPAQAPQPTLSPIEQLGVQLDAAKAATAAAAARLNTYGLIQRSRDPQGYQTAIQALAQARAAEAPLRAQYEALVLQSFQRGAR